MTEGLSLGTVDEMAEYVDAVDEMAEAWDRFREAWEDFRFLHAKRNPQQSASFRAYLDAQVQGEEHGWLGGPFLADEIRKVTEAVG